MEEEQDEKKEHVGTGHWRKKALNVSISFLEAKNGFENGDMM